METASKKTINLYLESNPNPDTLKFVANCMLVPAGESYEFPTSASAVHAPLAKALFDFKYVSRVFYMSNFVTITKTEDVAWEAIQDELKTFIKAYLESDRPLLSKRAHKADKQLAAQEDTAVVQRIKRTLDEYIKPVVEQDGGAITFYSFNEGTLKVLLQGSCKGCPSATVTLKAGIENLLKRIVPEVETVEAEGV